jgi:hypothetical protein
MLDRSDITPIDKWLGIGALDELFFRASHPNARDPANNDANVRIAATTELHDSVRYELHWLGWSGHHLSSAGQVA